MEEHFLGAAVGERVGVEACSAFGGVHDACCVGVVRHVRYATQIKSVLHGCGAGVVFKDDTPLVAGYRLGGAMAEPEEVPVVAVGGVWDGVDGGTKEPLSAESVVEELGAEGCIPIGVVFEGKGGGEAVVNNTMAEG